MPYRLRKNETVVKGVKRLAAEQIDYARGQLAQNDDAQKSVKKTRALLRLAGYSGEDKRLRNIGRALSEVRDAAVMIEVFDALVEKQQSAIGKEGLAGIRRGLVESMRSADSAKAVASAQAGLEAARQRLDRWPIENAFADGLETTYRRGRKMLRRARKNGRAQSYHDFRKRVKEHWYHMRLVGPRDSRTASLKDLESWLGEHHNLEEKLEKNPERFGDREAIEIFLALAAAEQRKLAQDSIALGRRLYQQKPKQFVDGLTPKKQPAKANLPAAVTERSA
jgi:CHAD domain